jgi:nitroreductase
MFPQVLAAIDGLFSCHGNFTGEEIPEKELDIILESAVRAATASGQQSYSVIVLDDKGVMKELTGYAGSRALVFCADGSRLNGAARRLGFGTGEKAGMESFVTWSIDTLLAAQNACLAARALGIDSLFTNGINRMGLDKAWRLLKLPQKDCFPLITLILGYATEKPERKRGRLTGAGVVHRGQYQLQDQKALDRMIADYDDEGLNLGMNRTFEAKGDAHYLEWFFRDWLGGFPDNTDNALTDRLKRSGFMN